MNEEQKKEEKGNAEKATAGNTAAGNQPEKLSSYEKVKLANEAAERLENASKEAAEKIHELSELQALQRLGGGTEAGQEPKKPEETESPTEYMEKALANKLPK